MTERQINFLIRWLKVTPTPKPNPKELKNNSQKFTRKPQLIKLFESETLISFRETREIISDSLVKNTSKFYPHRNQNKLLDSTIDFTRQRNLSKSSKYKTNLRKEDCEALNELKNDKTIIVKETDQGGAVVGLKLLQDA